MRNWRRGSRVSDSEAQDLTWETFSSWETGGETGGIPRHSYQSSCPPMSNITNNSQHIARQRLEPITSTLIRGKYTTPYNFTPGMSLTSDIWLIANCCYTLQKRSKACTAHWHSTRQKEVAFKYPAGTFAAYLTHLHIYTFAERISF